MYRKGRHDFFSRSKDFSSARDIAAEIEAESQSQTQLNKTSSLTCLYGDSLHPSPKVESFAEEALSGNAPDQQILETNRALFVKKALRVIAKAEKQLKILKQKSEEFETEKADFQQEGKAFLESLSATAPPAAAAPKKRL